MGGGNLYIIAYYIFPNMIGPLVVIFAIRISRGILSIASLSFLGLGLQPPTPDWGVMIRDAIMYFRGYPLLIIAPGIAIFVTSLSINLLGDALRDYFDVHIKE
jgi:peptide/nickel transport system permease protein